MSPGQESGPIQLWRKEGQKVEAVLRGNLENVLDSTGTASRRQTSQHGKKLCVVKGMARD